MAKNNNEEEKHKDESKNYMLRGIMNCFLTPLCSSVI